MWFELDTILLALSSQNSCHYIHLGRGIRANPRMDERMMLKRTAYAESLIKEKQSKSCKMPIDALKLFKSRSSTKREWK